MYITLTFYIFSSYFSAKVCLQENCNIFDSIIDISMSYFAIKTWVQLLIRLLLFKVHSFVLFFLVAFMNVRKWSKKSIFMIYEYIGEKRYKIWVS